MPDHSAPSVAPSPPPVSWGTTSKLGVGLGALGIIGALLDANGTDTEQTAALVQAIGGVLALLVTLGGRYAQAVALARSVAVTASPWVDAIQAALAAPSPVQAEKLEALSTAYGALTEHASLTTPAIPSIVPPPEKAKLRVDAYDFGAMTAGIGRDAGRVDADAKPPDESDAVLQAVDGDVSLPTGGPQPDESESIPDREVEPEAPGLPRHVGTDQ